MEIKNKGHISVFAVIVFAFVSWAVFSTSFLISEELFVLKDQKELKIRENKENILEAIFLKKISEIENKILNENGNQDIIWYFMKKGENLLWTENYIEIPKSDNGFYIEKIYIKNYNGKTKEFNFSNWKNSFKYANLIENYSIPQKPNEAYIYFCKELKGVYVEEMEDKIYNIKISGNIHTRYFYKKKFNMNALTFCKIEELKFEIYDI